MVGPHNPSNRTDLTNRTPTGMIASWWNVSAFALLMISFPVGVLSGGLEPARVAFALSGLAITVAMELVFLRKLVQRIAGRRALRAEHADDG